MSNCTKKELNAKETTLRSEKNVSIFAKERELNIAYIGHKSLILIRFKESLFSTIDLDPNLPNVFWFTFAGIQRFIF